MVHSQYRFQQTHLAMGSSGTKTVVVSVIEGSSPFYLTGTGNDSILVRGVTRFTERTPIIQTVVDRGTSITFGAPIN